MSGVGRPGVLIPTKKMLVSLKMKCRYPVQYTANRVLRRTTSSSQMTYEAFQVSLVSFDDARSGPWGHLRLVRKYAYLSMSFMTSAASLKSNIRNADAAFSV